MKMYSFTLAFLLSMQMIAQSAANSKSEATILYDDDRVTVSMVTEICDDPHSDLQFEYYSLTLVNKTDRKVNVQFWSQGHASESSEFFHSHIVSPNEVLEGSCETSTEVGLKFFRKDIGVPGEAKSLGLVDFATYTL